jgi:hypothetical protein
MPRKKSSSLVDALNRLTFINNHPSIQLSIVKMKMDLE